MTSSIWGSGQGGVIPTIKIYKDCLVSQKINNRFLALKEYNKIIKEPKFVERFENVRDLCVSAIEIKREIEILCVVLFPEYSRVKIDLYSLNNFLDDKEKNVKVCLFTGLSITESAYVYFEPKKTKEV